MANVPDNDFWQLHRINRGRGMIKQTLEFATQVAAAFLFTGIVVIATVVVWFLLAVAT
jgi:hypothetical protein